MPKTAHAPATPKKIADEILKLSREGRWPQLEQRARSVAMRQPANALGWRALGTALLQQGRFADAASALGRLVKLLPGHVGAHNDLGLAFSRLGRAAEAEASYRCAMRADPRDAASHDNLGLLLADEGRVEEALALHRQAVALDPLRPESHGNIGSVWRLLGRYDEAEASFRRALELRPDYFEAHYNLGLTLADLGRFDEALDPYRRAVSLRPDAYVAALALATLLSRIGTDEAEIDAALRRCLALEPDNADGHVALGNDLLRRKDLAQARAVFRRAQDLRPLIVQPAATPQPAFTVLLLDTPGAGSTPVHYLTGSAPYACRFYCVLPETPRHLELLRTGADVVFNMIADADNGAEMLPHAARIVEALGLPTVNPPSLIARSGRKALADKLAGTPFCRVPATRLLPASALMTDAGGLDGLSLPLLVRKAGTHGGDVFEKFGETGAIAGFVAAHPDADFYVTEFVDYRSPDGFFRKYRFICIDGTLWPYHLAIHDHWMVHHFRTDMAHQAWMRDEEAAFLARPERVFGPDQQGAVLAMAKATALDYCGVDVALDPEGRVVLFECNASMLVHDEKAGPFTYKNPAIARIKAAFDAMLARRAGVDRAS